MSQHERDITSRPEPVESARRLGQEGPFTSAPMAVSPPHRIALLSFRLVGLAVLIGGFGGLALFASRMLGLPSAGFIAGHASATYEVLMAYFVIIPAIPMTLGLLLVPAMLGTGTTAFPKLLAPALWLYGLGVVCLIAAWLSHDTGSEASSPAIIAGFSGEAARLSPLVAIGIISAMLCSFIISVNLLATIRQRRRDNARAIRLSPFLCGMLCASAINVIVLPVAGVTVVLIWLSASSGDSAVAPVLGLNPEALRMLFWMSHGTAVTGAILPAIGLTTEIVARYSRSSLVTRPAIGLAIYAAALLAFIPSDPNIVPADSDALMALTSGLALLETVPLMIIVACWCLTLKRGVHTCTPGLLFALASMLFFANSIFTKLASAPLSASLYLEGSGFESAHLHLLWLGGIGLAGMGGVIDAWTLISKSTLHSPWLIAAWALIVEGAVVTFFPGFILGARGVRPGTLEHFNGLDALSQMSAAGQAILLSGMLFLIVAFVWPTNAGPIGRRFARHQVTA